MDRKSELETRIKELQTKKKAELSSEDRDDTYISDLNDSIRCCSRELKFLLANPGGVEIVNGV